MCLHHLLILCILIRVFNCLSKFSLKPEYTPKFSKSLKLEKSAKPEYPPKISKSRKNSKISKSRKNSKNAELYPPMLNTDRHRWLRAYTINIYVYN